MNGSEALTTTLSGLLHKLNPIERRRLNREIAKQLRTSHSERIKSQRNPDGSRYTARKPSYQPHNKPVSFIYHGVKRHLRSYRNEGDRLIGYDVETGGVKTFLRSKVERWLRPPKGGQSAKKPQKRRLRPMFGRLRSPRFIKLINSTDVAGLHIPGSAGRIAEPHQYGLRDQVRPGGPTVQYPVRQILGLTDQEIDQVRDIILNNLSL